MAVLQGFLPGVELTEDGIERYSLHKAGCVGVMRRSDDIFFAKINSHTHCGCFMPAYAAVSIR